MSDQQEMFLCHRCNAKLNPKRMVWLELNNRTGEWKPEGEVPAEDSQGCFPFGKDCAPEQIREYARG